MRWAARLAPPGHDLLLYHRAHPRQTTPADAGPGRQRVELRLSQMAALLLAVSLADRLQQPLADALTDQVRAARCDHLVKRWVLHPTEDQLAGIAYVFWLHKTTGSAAEARASPATPATPTNPPPPRAPPSRRPSRSCTASKNRPHHPATTADRSASSPPGPPLAQLPAAEHRGRRDAATAAPPGQAALQRA
ncbi:DUF6417 family protein [Streptomyces sp. NPDC005811]|uniref:DUF6417 family protein n=1 Tax=Streptomyces sp. NPDC005811 TaxID=3154565 RepID=UPI0033D0AAE2